MAPKDLVANVENENSILLTFTAPIDTSVVGFNLYKKEDLSKNEFEKINSKLLTESVYIDKNVRKGTAYSYTVRSVNVDGMESAPSNISGAPKMLMNTAAVVSHMGKPTRIATPGDIIKYDIGFANRGFGVAKNVVIVYAIPKGTTFISGTAKCPKYKVRITYYDESAGTWMNDVAKEETISKVKYTLLEDILPVSKDTKDAVTLKVMVNY
jgi:uncharacterized repeat protein (TIGR01451 family)